MPLCHVCGMPLGINRNYKYSIILNHGQINFYSRDRSQPDGYDHPSWWKTWLLPRSERWKTEILVALMWH